MSGGFMGGLAQGIATGVQLDNQRGYLDLQKQYADRQTHADARDAELHNARMDEFKRARAANDEVASFLSGGNQAAQQPQSGLAPSTGKELVSDTRAPGLSMVSDQQPVSDTRAPGLSDVSTPAAPQAPQIPAGQVIAKNVLTGNLLADPNKMTAIANIYAKHGLTDKMIPWMNQAYQAKKSGIVDALPYLIAGDGKNAAAMLQKGGMDIQGTPTLVDKQNQVWSFNIGGQPREISMRQIVGMADPENWLKMQQEQPERDAKVALTKAQINAQNANAAESLANASLTGVKTKLAKSGALGGDAGGNLPSQAALAEWMVANGVAPDKKSAWDKVKTLGDKSPEAARMELVQSVLKGGMATPEEAIKQADQVIAAMQPKQSGGTAGAMPTGAVRKFNPQTGRFD